MWRGRWNDGDCDVGLYNEAIAHIPRARRPDRESGAMQGVEVLWL